MKLLLGFFLWVSTSIALGQNDIPHIDVADTINPGSADYIISGIEKAEADGAPYFVIQMDTPGGLLTATRQIVQKMLASKIPIVVFVGPKGAHAGSAGALITFAADVAVMAPGTNIGAAHPVVPGENKIDDTMNEKITNDTAAFAEGLAKAKGRNADWAIKSVRNSASVIAEEALKLNVIDFIAEDTNDLMVKLAGFKLRVAKGTIKTLPAETMKLAKKEMSIKQRLVSFFANPNIAYILMSFAGLCIWIELSNPGLIVPGVIGGICVILSMISFQMLPIHYGALAFIILGIVLLIAEAFVPSFGILGISGITSFVFGSLFLMDTNVPEFQISLGLIIPTAATLAVVALVFGTLIYRAQRTKVATGMDALVGQIGTVREPVSNQPGGTVFVQGELWRAISDSSELIPIEEEVRIKEIKRMVLKVEPTNKGVKHV